MVTLAFVYVCGEKIRQAVNTFRLSATANQYHKQVVDSPSEVYETLWSTRNFAKSDFRHHLRTYLVRQVKIGAYLCGSFFAFYHSYAAPKTYHDKQ